MDDRSALKEVSLSVRKMETTRFSKRQTINMKLHGLTSHKTICFSTLNSLKGHCILSQGSDVGNIAPGPKRIIHTFVYTTPVVADLYMCVWGVGWERRGRGHTKQPFSFGADT